MFINVYFAVRPFVRSSFHFHLVPLDSHWGSGFGIGGAWAPEWFAGRWPLPQFSGNVSSAVQEFHLNN